MKESAGALLYRREAGQWLVLLVHPSGNYNKRAPWSIPKGLPDPGEPLEAAARRETREETAIEAGKLVKLGSVDYVKSRKRVHCFVGPAPEDATPRCGSWEVDRVEFVTLEEAESLLHPDQRPFIEWLRQALSSA